jgi:hypothetical protein
MWKELPPEKRLVAAGAFWADEHGVEQHVEVIVMIARKMNFRPKSVPRLPVERRAKLLAGMPDVSDAVASRALIAYHLTAERPMMAVFLDALGIEHDDGLINTPETEEGSEAQALPPPDKAKIVQGIAALRAAYPEDAVLLYLHTLVVLDGDTWSGLEGLIDPVT